MSEHPALSHDIIAAAQRADLPDFARWQQMVRATGGCARPIRLQGERLTVDAATGEVLEVYGPPTSPPGIC